MSDFLGIYRTKLSRTGLTPTHYTRNTGTTSQAALYIYSVIKLGNFHLIT